MTPNPTKNGLKYWCLDETRIGLKTIEGKKNTALGVGASQFGKYINWRVDH
jgi:hypothetical protein